MLFKNWAFKFFIYTIILNIIVTFLVVQSTIFNDFSTQIIICGLLSNLILIAGIIFGIFSYKNKEENDFKKKLGLYGNLTILSLSIVLQIFAYV